VMAPPSKDATTARPSAGANANRFGLHVIAHLGWRRHGCVGPLKKLDTITGESILTAG
jgi:hypothetical protein